MNRFLCVLVAVVGIVPVLGGAPSVVHAVAPIPHTPVMPPRPPDSSPPPPDVSDAGEFHSVALPSLKAVLIVGPIDGDDGDWTNYEKRNMDLAAAELQANGVTVHRFYAPDNDWEQIKSAARGAHFLLYRGHGVYWPPPGMPSPQVGGFALKNRIISSDEIRTGLNVAPGAIVMLYACFAAGGSSLDNVEIGSAEAQRRVAQYSEPFLGAGAGGYYANWYGNAPQMFIRYLFRGMTLGGAYETYFDFDPESVERSAHPDHPNNAVWLDKNFWSNRWQYCNAFAGLADRTLEDLFTCRAMVVTPLTITFQAQARSEAESFPLEVECTTNEIFSWAAAVMPEGASWIELQPVMQGSSGQQVSVVLNPAELPAGTYEANIHIKADDGENFLNGDQIVQVEMKVSGEMTHQVFLPMVMR